MVASLVVRIIYIGSRFRLSNLIKHAHPLHYQNTILVKYRSYRIHKARHRWKANSVGVRGQVYTPVAFIPWGGLLEYARTSERPVHRRQNPPWVNETILWPC
jgi:hypothetical protein